MLLYVLARLLGAIPTLFAIILISFVLMRAAPGGPFDEERVLPPEVEASLRTAYHLDEPLPVQFAQYLEQILRFDFGPSFKYKDFSVNDLIASGAPVSATIGGLSLVLATLLGVAMGSLAALRRGHWIDQVVMLLALIGQVIPTFVVGPLLALLFGLWLGLLPLGGWNDGALSNLILPIVTLALPYIASIARLMRASMIETLHQNFIRTARAKGLSETTILWRHALRPALLPVVSYLGPAAASLMTGSVVVETVFGLPGIGRYFVQGAINRDYTLVLGVVILYGALIVLFNLLVDLAYGWLDPKLARS